jgi:hypothetical protein
MSARDFIDAVIWGHTGLSDERNEVIAGRLEAALMDMPLPDRLALARALVPDHVIGPRELPASVGGMYFDVDEITPEGIWRKVVGLMEADHG